MQQDLPTWGSREYQCFSPSKVQLLTSPIRETTFMRFISDLQKQETVKACQEHITQ